MIYIVGLGNPGEEYEYTRHNIGRMAVEDIAAHFDIADSLAGFKYDKVLDAKKAKGSIGGTEVILIAPETFMNRSGKSVAPLILGSTLSARIGSSLKSKATIEKKTQDVIVIQDDIDMPLGQIKIVFKRGSGGHNGIESITKSLHTDAYLRIKIGIIPTTPDGEMKKPQAGEKVTDFVLGKFQTGEMEIVKKSLARVREIIKSIAVDGRVAAMNTFN